MRSWIRFYVPFIFIHSIFHTLLRHLYHKSRCENCPGFSCCHSALRSWFTGHWFILSYRKCETPSTLLEAGIHSGIQGALFCWLVAATSTFVLGWLWFAGCQMQSQGSSDILSNVGWHVGWDGSPDVIAKSRLLWNHHRLVSNKKSIWQYGAALAWKFSTFQSTLYFSFYFCYCFIFVSLQGLWGLSSFVSFLYVWPSSIPP